MRLAIVTLGLAVSWLAAAPSQVPPPHLKAFLAELGFGASELAQLEKGKVLVKLPKTAETREVAVVAVTPINVTADFFIERVQDIVTFSKSEHILQIGKFSSPPRLEDLANLTFEDSELDSLRRCKPKSCDIKLPADWIGRFHKEINWSLSNYRERATALWKEILVDYTRAYLRAGNNALIEYNDKSEAVKLGREFKTLLQPTPYTYLYAPEFQAYLEQFPNSAPAAVEHFVYWSKDTFGLKPVVSLTHLAITRYARASGTVVLMASKGIYASHYLESSLGFTTFIEDQPQSSYLIYVNRSRSDALRGILAGLKRALIGGRVRDGARRNMELTKSRLEGEFRQRRPL